MRLVLIGLLICFVAAVAAGWISPSFFTEGHPPLIVILMFAALFMMSIVVGGMLGLMIREL